MKISSFIIIITLSAFLFSFVSLEASENYLKLGKQGNKVEERGLVKLDIPRALTQAIYNNVSLTFCMNLRLTRKVGPFFLPLESEIKCLTVKRYAIGNNFIVIRDSTNKTTTYADLDEVFQSMEQLISLFPTSISKKKLTNSYILLRWKLDRRNLPAPLLLTTFFSKAWNFNTGWIIIKEL